MTRHAQHPGLRRRQPPLRDPGRADQVPARPVPKVPSTTSRCGVAPRSWSGARSASTSPTRPSRWWPPGAPWRTTSASATPKARAGARSSASPCGRSRPSASPAARLELMDEQGIDRALMFPTLASLVEERMRDDPELTHAVIHALNQWMHETWTVQLRGPDLRHAGHHPAHRGAGHRGARVGRRARRPGRARSGRPRCPGFRGPRSFGLPEFDPFWEKVVEHDVLVAMHSSDSGYERYTNDWMGNDSEMLPFQPQAFRMLSGWRPVEDAVAALVCHGALSRFPDLKVAVIENGSSWVAPLLEEPGRHLQEDAAGLRRGPGRGHQAQHLHQPVLGGGPGRAGRAHRRRPRAVRLGLPPPRGPGRSGQLRRRARRRLDESGAQDHGRQPGPADERGRRGRRS